MLRFELNGENEFLYLEPGYPPLLERGKQCGFLIHDQVWWVDGTPSDVIEKLRSESRELLKPPRGRPPKDIPISAPAPKELVAADV